MKAFGKEAKHKPNMGGDQWVYAFPNGYGASVIRNPYSYGGDRGLYELAVFHPESLCYASPITNDVKGYQTEPDIEALLAAIEALPRNDECTHDGAW